MKTLLKTTNLLILQLVIIISVYSQSLSFENNYDGTCAPATFKFYVTSAHIENVQYTWIIESNYFTGDTIEYEFQEGGDYTVFLYATDTLYGTSYGNIYNSIYINGIPTSFYMSDTLVCPGEKLYFSINDNYSNYQYYKWDFGDYGSSSDSWVSHVYNEPGDYPVTLILQHNLCGKDTIKQNVTISGELYPEVSISIDGEQSCPNDPIYFDIINGNDSYQYLWNFGGETSSSPSPIYSYSTPGFKEITLTTTNLCGNSATDTSSVEIRDDIIIDYVYFYNSAPECPKTPVSFSCYNQGNLIWNFGDGTNSTQRNPEHIYKDTGNYLVNLLVYNGCGSYKTETANISIEETMNYPDEIEISFRQPNVDTNTITVCPGEEVIINNNLIYSYVDYIWDFGDGTEIISNNDYYISHVFVTEGTFKIKITAVHPCGGKNYDSLYVIVSSEAIPYVNLGFAPDTICTGDLVYFYLNEENQFKPGYTFYVDYGDGDQSGNITNYDYHNGIVAEHNYSSTSTFTFQATNMCGNSVDTSAQIIVNNNANRIPYYYWGNSAGDEVYCTYEMDYEDNRTWIYPITNDSIAYISFFKQEVAQIMINMYNMGYTSGPNDEEPIVISHGNYTIKGDTIILSENSSFGCSGEAVYTFTNNLKSLSFSNYNDYCLQRIELMEGKSFMTIGGSLVQSPYPVIPKRSVCPGDTINFNVFGATNLTWYFGDGQTSNLPMAVHAYADTGIYKAYALVTNGCSRQDTLYAPVRINMANKPNIEIGYDQYPLIAGDSVQFYYYSNSDYYYNDFTYYWDFGNGKSSSLPYPKIIFDEPGYYKVSFTYTNGCGTSAITEFVEVIQNSEILPVANAGISQYADFGQAVTLDASASRDGSGGTNLTYSWLSLDPTISLSNVKISNPSFTVPAFTLKNELIFMLEVTDKTTGLKNQDFVIIYLQNNIGVFSCYDAVDIEPGEHLAYVGWSENYENGTPQWYRFMAPSDGEITISNCGNTSLDTYLKTYDYCGSYGEYYNNNCNMQENITLNVSSGQLIYIFWGSNQPVSPMADPAHYRFNWQLIFTPYSNTDFSYFYIGGQIVEPLIDRETKTIKAYIDLFSNIEDLYTNFEVCDEGAVVRINDSIVNPYSYFNYTTFVIFTVTSDTISQNWTVFVEYATYGADSCMYAIDMLEGINPLNFEYDYENYVYIPQWYLFTAPAMGKLKLKFEKNLSYYPNLTIYKSCGGEYIYSGNSPDFQFITEPDTTYYFKFDDTYEGGQTYFYMEYLECGAWATFNYETRDKSIFVKSNIPDTNYLGYFSYNWDFGDGTIIEDTLSFIHLYNTPGIYNVSLTVTDRSNPLCYETKEIKAITYTIQPQYSQVLYVAPYGSPVNSGTYDYPLVLESAIYYSSSEIILLDGEYFVDYVITMENGNYMHSEKGTDSCIINFNKSDMGWIDFNFDGIIEGITIKNALNEGIRINSGNPVIKNNIIDSCSYAIMIDSYSNSSSPVIEGNLIKNCTNDGIQAAYGNGLWPVLIKNNTIANNSNFGIYIGGMNVDIVNNILYNNIIGIYKEPYINTIVKVNYNDFYANITDTSGNFIEEGNLSTDPLFDDLVNYLLSEFSPCIDAGDPLTKTDPDGTCADIGYRYFYQAPNGEQYIELFKGWNIISFYVQPPDMDLYNILYPMIDKQSLIKVQNEAGFSIEEIFNHWNNYIGNMDVSEGYQVKMDAFDSLLFYGWTIDLPFDISLNSGWNMMGFPCSEPQDAMTILGTIYPENSWIKIQSQNGTAIEIVNPIGLVNTIGNFIPGQGYHIKLYNNATITIYNANPEKKASIAATKRNETSRYFLKAWNGNGMDHMNIYFSNISINGRSLQSGDEIAIYDNDVCVGVYVHSKDNELTYIIASKDDPATVELDGFREGDIIQAKVWDSKEKMFIPNAKVLPVKKYKNIFESKGTTVLELKAGNTITDVNKNFDIITSLGNNYPNPFSDETHIDYTIATKTHVTISVYNLLGEKIITLIDEEKEPGQYKVSWNKQSDKGNTIMNGIYIYRMETDNYIAVKQMILL